MEKDKWPHNSIWLDLTSFSPQALISIYLYLPNIQIYLVTTTQNIVLYLPFYIDNSMLLLVQ